VPANRLDNGGPGFDFVRCIWVAFHRLPQVLTRNDVHLPKILFTICEVVKVASSYSYLI
jgi:hypothetical protein